MTQKVLINNEAVAESKKMFSFLPITLLLYGIQQISPIFLLKM
jgi:hypothetical protein